MAKVLDDRARNIARRPVLLELRSSTRFIVLSASIAFFQDGFLYGSVVPVLPFSLRERSGVPERDVQFWNSTFLVVFGVFQTIGGPIAGWWSQHFRSQRMPFLFGLLCAFAATTLFMLARSMAVLIAARVAQGISAAIVNTYGLALLADTVDRRQMGFYMGVALSGMTLGILVAPPLSAVIYEKAGYEWVFAVGLMIIGVDMTLRLMMIEKTRAREWSERADHSSALEGSKAVSPGLAATICEGSYGSIEQAYAVPSRPQEETASGSTNITVDQQHHSETSALLAKPTPVSQKNVLRRCLPTSLLLLTSPSIAAAVYGCIVHAILLTSFDATLPIFVSRTFGWNAERAGAILLALTVFPLLSFIPGALADRYGTCNIALTGFIMSTICILVMGLIRTAEVSQIVILALLLFFTSVGMSLFLSPLAADLSVSVEAVENDQPDLIGTTGAMAQVYSLFNVALGLGTIAGPILSGALYDNAGWFVMCTALAVLCFSGSLPVILFMRGERREKWEG